VTPGVGPATALAALRMASRNELRPRDRDRRRQAGFAQIPGIGPKTASRIVLELKGKVASTGGAEASSRPAGALERHRGRACARLVTTSREIRQALDGVELPDNEPDALREALAHLRRA